MAPIRRRRSTESPSLEPRGDNEAPQAVDGPDHADGVHGNQVALHVSRAYGAGRWITIGLFAAHSVVIADRDRRLSRAGAAWSLARP